VRPLFCCCGGRPLGVPFSFLYIRGKIKPQRIRRGFTVQQREKSNEPFVDMFELGFVVALLFFCFSDYFNFAD
jgi:hypothetical protein